MELTKKQLSQISQIEQMIAATAGDGEKRAIDRHAMALCPRGTEKECIRQTLGEIMYEPYDGNPPITYEMLSSVDDPASMLCNRLVEKQINHYMELLRQTKRQSTLEGTNETLTTSLLGELKRHACLSIEADPEFTVKNALRRIIRNGILHIDYQTHYSSETVDAIFQLAAGELESQYKTWVSSLALEKGRQAPPFRQ